jgi:hypothetical protein
MDFREDRGCVERLVRKAEQRNPTLVLPSQQRLHKLSFLQKLGCQKPCWDLIGFKAIYI